mmetsp:Transcript_25684/g.82960  ORF Transcript_25684/g.82960 Transcript_25684/m.82960 type:complete len:272 (+) Transcript_25684:176-991(+)|eukprot:scaffold18810_cov118-Isochrysis_galbana.AAC.4
MGDGEYSMYSLNSRSGALNTYNSTFSGPHRVSSWLRVRTDSDPDRQVAVGVSLALPSGGGNRVVGGCPRRSCASEFLVAGRTAPTRASLPPLLQRVHGHPRCLGSILIRHSRACHASSHTVHPAGAVRLLGRSGAPPRALKQHSRDSRRHCAYEWRHPRLVQKVRGRAEHDAPHRVAQVPHAPHQPDGRGAPVCGRQRRRARLQVCVRKRCAEAKERSQRHRARQRTRRQGRVSGGGLGSVDCDNDRQPRECARNQSQPCHHVRPGAAAQE